MRSRIIRALVSVLLLAVLSSSFSAYAAAPSRRDDTPEIGEYIQVSYDDSGLLSNEANTILHTTDGYIWIGSYSGLSRYDSTSFVSYGDDDSSIMCGVSVRTLFEDRKGRLWIGSNEKGVYLYENGTFSRVNTDNISQTGSIRAFAETDAGIYVASTGGILLINDNLEVHQIGVADIGTSHVAGMMTDRKGRLWIIDNDTAVVLEGHHVVCSLDMSGYVSSECNCIAQLSDGRVIIGTGGSDVVYLTPEGDSFAAEAITLDDRRTSDIHNTDCQTVNYIFEDDFGRIWICSDTGLGYIDGGEFFVANGVNIASIEHIEMDYEGNLWLASSRNGVMQLVRGKFNDKSLSTSLHGVTVNATQIYEGKLFAATDTGVQVLDPVTFESIQHPMADLLDGIRVRGLFVDSQGYLWITTYVDYGAVRYKDGEYVSISADDGLTSNKTRVAMELPNGDIAISTGSGVSIIRGTQVIKTYTEADGLYNPVILSMCIDKEGKLYFGSDGNGIYVVSTDGSISNITSQDGLGSDVILNLKYDSWLDAVFVSTGSSLALLEKNGVRQLESFTAGTGSIFDLLFLDDAVWVLRNTSVIVTDRDQLLSDDPPSEYTVLGRKDGLIDITSNSRHCVDENGNLYLATSNGVYTINTEDFGGYAASHRAKINSVFADGVEHLEREPVVLPPGTSRLTIEFTALNYSTDNCIVEYQLVGADEEPILVKGDKALTRDYTNLKGGSYVFRVSVLDSSGSRSGQVLEMNIRKQLSFFEKPVFIIAAVLLSVALLAAIITTAVYMRTRSLLERQNRYHSLTESALHVAARSIDAKDSYTNGHSSRVAALSVEIARRLGWSDEAVENVYYTALVHDIGKIGVPDSLLTKPSRLTDEEYQVIRTHVTMGYNILREFEGVPDIALGARYHHERYDGNGYCEGLRGEDIPIVARIIAVADAYDAMTSTRVYRSCLTREAARNEIIRCRGTQFDPQIADIMLEMLDEGFDACGEGFDPYKEDNQKDN